MTFSSYIMTVDDHIDHLQSIPPPIFQGFLSPIVVPTSFHKIPEVASSYKGLDTVFQLHALSRIVHMILMVLIIPSFVSFLEIGFHLRGPFLKMVVLYFEQDLSLGVVRVAKL